MNETRARRRFWQLHLSTALVMMLIASGVVYLNVLPRRSPIRSYGYPTISYSRIAQKLGIEEPPSVKREYGWPWRFMMQTIEIERHPSEPVTEFPSGGYFYAPGETFDDFVEGSSQNRIQWWALSGNVSIAFAVLMCAVVSCEFIIRRRKPA
jgi:hypothetical protein